MKRILENSAERDFRVFEVPLSSIRQDGEKIRYFDFISSLQNKECNAALRRIMPKIDMNKINALIEETPFITDMEKTFYKTMLVERKEKILDKSSQLLRKRERELER